MYYRSSKSGKRPQEAPQECSSATKNVSGRIRRPTLPQWDGYTNWQCNSADFQVLPLLLIGFATYQLDRTNLSSALTGGLAHDLSVSQNTINLGNQLMFLGVISLELPSNVILYKVNYFFLITRNLLIAIDRSPLVDSGSSPCLWHHCRFPGLYSKQGWVLVDANSPGPHRSGLYTRCYVYPLYMVHKGRNNETHCNFLFRHVWWYCNITFAGRRANGTGR